MEPAHRDGEDAEDLRRLLEHVHELRRRSDELSRQIAALAARVAQLTAGVAADRARAETLCERWVQPRGPRRGD